MDAKTLVVGQEVSIFGCGFFKGTVVRLIPNGVEVESFGLLAQFDEDGKETEDSLYRRVGGPGPGPEWEPWELKSLDEVHFERDVPNWLLEFLKGGEKPADEVLKEAEKKFGDAGDAVRRASDQLIVSKRQENCRWYWSLRWELDENNRVVGLAPRGY